MSSLSVVVKGRWLWLMLTLVNVISSQQLCPNYCLQCDLNMRCLKCAKGYYGELCNIPCGPVCRKGKCRMDGSCDDFEKGVLKVRRMRRNTGVNCHDAECTCCKSNYTGPNCQVPCPNCRTRYMSGDCNRYCEAGFYGAICDETCSTNCAPIEDKTGKHIREATGAYNANCSPGYFGEMCKKTCPPACKNHICLQGDGTCVECNDKDYGVSCNKKCHGCKESCFRSGRCKQGCIDGYYGTMCNLRCGTDCTEGGKCQMYEEGQQRICTDGCQYIAASHSVIYNCVAAASSDPNSSNAETIAPAVVVPVSLVIVVLVILFLRRKRVCCWRRDVLE